jgi:hypothetical protein
LPCLNLGIVLGIGFGKLLINPIMLPTARAKIKKRHYLGSAALPFLISTPGKPLKLLVVIG